jgi:hypothetical protein
MYNNSDIVTTAETMYKIVCSDGIYYTIYIFYSIIYEILFNYIV